MSRKRKAPVQEEAKAEVAEEPSDESAAEDDKPSDGPDAKRGGSRSKMPDEIADFILTQRISRENEIAKAQHSMCGGKTLKDIYVDIGKEVQKTFHVWEELPAEELFNKVYHKFKNIENDAKVCALV